MSDTVWSIATKEVETQIEKKKEEKLLGEERTILIVGAKQSGKTSLLLKFLEKHDERPKPSVALEYTFARRPKPFSLEKDVVHLWELAGGTFLSDLTDAVLTPETLPGLSIALTLDLSQPQTIWVTLEHLLNELRQKVEKVMASNSEVKRTLEKSNNDRILTFAKGFDTSSMFPLPLIIIGTKYDAFVNLDSVEKKMITRTLRFVAHTQAAHILFVSEKVPSTLKYFKVFFNQLAFNVNMQRVVAIDESKPIAISAGHDDSLAIGGPVTSEGSALTDVYAWKDWKKHFVDFFPQKSLDSEQNLEDPAKDPDYAEPVIDELMKQKFTEVENLRRKERMSKKDNRV